MWIWQLIIRRAKKVTIPLTERNFTPIKEILILSRRYIFYYNAG